MSRDSNIPFGGPDFEIRTLPDSISEAIQLPSELLKIKAASNFGAPIISRVLFSLMSFWKQMSFEVKDVILATESIIISALSKSPRR